MDKRKLWLYLLIFMLGILAGFAIGGISRKNDTGAATMAKAVPDGNALAMAVPDGNAKTSPAASTRAVLTNLSGTAPASAYPAWDKAATYTGGDKVVHEGRIYKAKWWTLGEIPGQADVWENTLETPQKAGAWENTPETSGQAGVWENTPETPQKAAAAPAKTTAGRPSGQKIVGYYPDWKGYQPEKARLDLLTHITYAFAIPTSDGALRPLEHPETAVRLIQDAHASQVKVLLAVGGWSYNGAELEPVFMDATSTSAKTRQFGDNILAMCEQYGFDGVDIDWEHPRVDGSSKDQYQELILYLSEQLHAQGKILTSAVISGVSADGNVYYDAAAHSDAVLEAVDWIHIMAYDGGDGERHSSYDFAVNCASYWCGARQLPREKAVLGVPFYGRPSWASYEDILKADPDAYTKDHAVINGMDAYYNGIATMEKKAGFARDNLGGIMIWELTQDTDDRDKSLLSAIGRGMAQ